MPAPAKVLAEAERASARIRLDVGEDVHRARHICGLSLRDAATLLGCSATTLSRLERGSLPNAPISLVIRYAAVVGLHLRVAVYPSDTAVRDAGQLRLLNRLRPHVGPGWRWLIELPVGPNDLRAFDAGLLRPGCRIGVDAWSRMRDIQAQVRATMRKATDAGVDRLILVFADTPHNRRALRDAGDALRHAFPLSTRATLAALRVGHDPGANGIGVI